jgi:predicted ATPase/DNA-binding XRE family transcriptional regulator
MSTTRRRWEVGVRAMDNQGMAGIWSVEDGEPFAELLRRLRLVAGLTQESLAQAAGISVDAVGTLERGTRVTPRADTARLLADALRLDGEDRQRFLSVSAPHPRQHAPAPSAWPVTGRSPPRRAPLPVPLTPLVGRAELVDQVCRVVAAGPRRLVTLTGPGGVGKTRVALAVASASAHTVGWVDLAPLQDPADVPYAIAETVGLASDPGRSPVDLLRHWAAKSHGLLVLDSCDSLLDAVADLSAGLLAGPEGVRVLATSRERIGVPGEHLIVVPPLRLPPPGRRDPDADAVRLFADRAAQAVPGFTLDDALLERVTEVCRALDGLPLAIELAAARVGAVTVDDLADRLDARFDLLSAPRGVDRRHHTMRAVIDWSYDMLSEPERLLFARLQVFAAEFDLTAAEAVAADERVPAAQIAHLVALLTDRSMLTRPGHAGVGLYRMLETLRAYARTRLSPEDLARVRRAHARYIAEMAEHADEGLAGPDEATRAGRIEAWLDDARAAFAWARDTGEIDLAMRLMAALSRYAFWRLRPDVLAWGEWAIKAVPDHPRVPLAYAAATAGAWLTGRLHEARSLAHRGITAAGGLAALGAAAPLELAFICAFLTTSTQTFYQGIAWSADERADAAPGDPTETLSACRALTALTAPHTAGRAFGLASQALTVADRDPAAARPTARDAVVHARASANPTAIALARFVEGRIAADEDPAAALPALDEARTVAAAVGCRLLSALTLTATVVLRGRHGPAGEALAFFHDAIGIWRETSNETQLGTLLSNLVVLLTRTGRDAEAVDLAAALLHARPNTICGEDAERLDTALARARQRLDARRYRAAWFAGARRGVDEAAERAQQLVADLVMTTRPLPHAS